MSNKKIIIGNWKMNPQSIAEVDEILSYINEHLNPRVNKNIVICPPFVFLEDVDRILKTSSLGKYVSLGSQDIAAADSGAWTGEVSGPMLRRLNVSHVIIGHSERRWKISESDEVVNKKLKTAIANDLTPIVCVGERERNDKSEEFIREQLSLTCAGLSPEQLSKCLFAYEPVWAISSNEGSRPDTPEDAVRNINIIKSITGDSSVVLYGGSVDSKNAADFLSQEIIDGVLVGSASLKKEEFVAILNL